MMDRIERIRQSFIPRRKAEQSDTRDQIQRHDPDYHKNKPNHRDGHDNNQGQDLNDITVESLIIFLHGLKKDEGTSDKTQPEKPVNQTMKTAIDAYGGGEHKPRERYTYLDDDEQDYDADMVDDLLNRLDALKAKGIDHITLVQAEGFLESIDKTLNRLIK